jgi:C-terminal processing protease CtpA/Prc
MNDMLKTALVALLSAMAGALLLLLLSGDRASTVPAATESQEVHALRERVAALESRLAMSRPVDDPPVRITESPLDDSPAEQAASAEALGEQRLVDRRESAARRLNARLRDAGWSDGEIDALTELRAEAALELEQQQYDMMRQRMQENSEELSQWRGRQSVMRAALGDVKYEQFLEAAGRPAAAEVRNVLAGSVGESAGLQQGDQIRRYGTTRVFDERDLMIALLDGEPGEQVSIEIERDGTTFYLTVPRGPLGISRAARYGMDY